MRVADALVDHQFTPPAPNVLWTADVTYLRTWEGWLYLAAVQDTYSRRVLGWQMTDHMQAELVLDALKMAITRRRPPPRAQSSNRPGLAIRRSCVPPDCR